MRQNIVIPDGKIANRSIIVTILCDFGIWAFCNGQKCLQTKVNAKNAHVQRQKSPYPKLKNSVAKTLMCTECAGQKYSSVGLKTKHGRANLITP